VSQNDSPEQRSRNRTIARSHVMKTVRRGQRRSIDLGGTSSNSRRRSSQSIRESQIAELLNRRSQTEADEGNALVATSTVLDEAFAQQLRQNFNSGYASASSRMEADLNSNPMFTNRWTPLAFEMLNHSPSSALWVNDARELIEMTDCRFEGHLAPVLARHFTDRV
jgi:hypothetical protein